MTEETVFFSNRPPPVPEPRIPPVLEALMVILISQFLLIPCFWQRHVQAGDFSSKTLARYAERLDNSFVMKDLRLYSRTSGYFQKQTQFLQTYPAMLAEAAHELLSVDSVPKQEKQRKILRHMLARRGPVALVKDAVGAFRALT